MQAAELRNKIQAADDFKTVVVPCPEWGCDVYVRTIPGTVRDQFEADSLVKRGKTREPNLVNLRARLVAVCACDAEGNRIFGDDDIAWLGQKASAPLDRVFSAAQTLNGFSDNDIEDLVKNSKSAQSGASGLS